VCLYKDDLAPWELDRLVVVSLGERNGSAVPTGTARTGFKEYIVDMALPRNVFWLQHNIVSGRMVWYVMSHYGMRSRMVVKYDTALRYLRRLQEYDV